MKNIWNHNFAYHSWIKKNINNRKRILDVGCGDGTLAKYLVNDENEIIGMDIDSNIISKIVNNNKNIKFLVEDFLRNDFKNEKFDAIIFVASIHHMDMEKALKKAKNLLNKNGVLLIVGLSKPSSIFDYIIEILRILPSKIISKINHMQTSEDLNLKVDYEIPQMKKIKSICQKEICNYKIKYGIHYRYLLKWIKK